MLAAAAAAGAVALWLGGWSEPAERDAAAVVAPRPRAGARADAALRAAPRDEPTAAAVEPRSEARRTPVPRAVEREAAPPAAFVALHGVLVSAGGDEPLCGVRLGLSSYGVAEDAEVVTALDGTFFVPAWWGERLTRVRFLDLPSGANGRGEARNLRPEPREDGALSLRVELGAAYRLDLRLETGASARERGPFVAELQTDERAVRRGADGEPDWVVVPGSGRRLRVVSVDGALVGSARVAGTAGIHPGVVRVVLEEPAALSGTVRAEDGSSPQGVRVKLHPIELEGSAPAGQELEHDASYRFDVLQTGLYRLSVEHDDETSFEPFSRDVLVARGANEEHVVLRRRPSVGAVRGTIRSESGRFRRERMHVSLWGSEVMWLGADVAWREIGGEIVGTFEFPRVPPARPDWKLQVSPATLGLFEWSPGSLVVEPPCEDVVFVCHDDEPCEDLVLGAVDAETGEPLDFFHRYRRPGERREFHACGRYSPPSCTFHSFPLARGLEWTVQSKGYVERSGTLADFVADASAERPTRVLRVELERSGD